MLSGAIGPRVCDDQRGAGGETPPFQNAKGGGIRRAVVRSPAVTVARHAQARPPPLVPVWVPTTDAATLLFLPPALSLLHPALYLVGDDTLFLTSGQRWRRAAFGGQRGSGWQR
jgi:hypothetical protein